MNLLIKSGGILKSGSLRSIYHFRNNALIDTIDLYPLISGTYSIKDVTFFDNDIIVVPSKGNTVAVTGCVRMPAYYEIINENVSSIVEFAGGVTRKSKPSLYLFRNSKPNLIIKRSNFDNLPLINGDSLYFPSIELKHRIVTVSVDNQNAKEIPWLNNLSYDDTKMFNYNNCEKYINDETDNPLLEASVWCQYWKDVKYKEEQVLLEQEQETETSEYGSDEGYDDYSKFDYV